jgi:sphingolipid delta-4 desaturase
MDFFYTDRPNYHLERRKGISLAYPEVKSLTGTNPFTSIYIFFLVTIQIALAYFLKGFPWWSIILLAYGFGAFVNHALYVLIHECCHNLVFRASWSNKILGIICDLAMAFPSALTFREYHLIHHKNLNENPGDPDVVSSFEGHLVGNHPLKKTIWILFFGISQGMRPLKMKGIKTVSLWTTGNAIAVFSLDILIFKFFGIKALSYLVLSTGFALGLHPCGGRWIQEHYTTEKDQETYSYYGPLNKVAFNMGYHNEHHDFMNIPWNNLPRLKKLAPEYYDHLKSYDSWIGVILNFIFNPQMGPFSKLIHRERPGKGFKRESSLPG